MVLVDGAESPLRVVDQFLAFRREAPVDRTLQLMDDRCHPGLQRLHGVDELRVRRRGVLGSWGFVHAALRFQQRLRQLVGVRQGDREEPAKAAREREPHHGGPLSHEVLDSFDAPLQTPDVARGERPLLRERVHRTVVFEDHWPLDELPAVGEASRHVARNRHRGCPVSGAGLGRDQARGRFDEHVVGEHGDGSGCVEQASEVSEMNELPAGRHRRVGRQCRGRAEETEMRGREEVVDERTLQRVRRGRHVSRGQLRGDRRPRRVRTEQHTKLAMAFAPEEVAAVPLALQVRLQSQRSELKQPGDPAGNVQTKPRPGLKPREFEPGEIAQARDRQISGRRNRVGQPRFERLHGRRTHTLSLRP